VLRILYPNSYCSCYRALAHSIRRERHSLELSLDSIPLGCSGKRRERAPDSRAPELVPELVLEWSPLEYY
jgi:hypothetical protein